jgi:hypothetical protein
LFWGLLLIWIVVPSAVRPPNVSQPLVPSLKPVPGIKRASKEAFADTAGIRANGETRIDIDNKSAA